MSRSRNFVFTLYDLPRISEFEAAPYSYLCYGKETCPTTSREHYQGYIRFTSARSFTSMLKKFKGVHLEIARGTPAHNITYCSKDGQFTEKGTRPAEQSEKGAKGGAKELARWQDAKVAAQQGRFDDIPPDIFFRHYRTCKEIRKDYMVKPDDLPTVCGVWYWGESGAGKSYTARRDFPDAFLKPCNKWWDGYQGEDHVLLDDFDKGHQVLGHHLKIWADRYAFIGENKGGAMCIRPKTIIITSQYPPEMIWDDHETLSAIRRRFTVKHFCTLGSVASITTDPSVSCVNMSSTSFS